MHLCHAIGCRTPCHPKFLCCRKHWAMVPQDLRDRVWGEYRTGQEIDKRPSMAWRRAAHAAIAAVAEIEGEQQTLEFPAGGERQAT